MRARMRQAAPATWLVFAVTSLCAGAFVSPLASSVPSRPLPEQPSVLALVTAIRLFDSLTGTPLRWFGLPVLVLLVATPFLQVLWLRAQLVAAPLHEHARAAAGAYLPACGVYAACGAYAALLAYAARLCTHAAQWLLRATHDDRLQHAVGLVLAAPLVLAVLLHAPSLSDRLQLELARGGRLCLRRVRSALAAVDARVCSVRAGVVLASGCLVLLGLLPRLWLGTSTAAGWALFVSVQLTAIARVFVRSAWLSWLTERALAASAPAADRRDEASAACPTELQR